MPLTYLLTIIIVVITTAGLTIAVISGSNSWIIILFLTTGLGLRAWMTRK